MCQEQSCKNAFEVCQRVYDCIWEKKPWLELYDVCDVENSERKSQNPVINVEFNMKRHRILKINSKAEYITIAH